MWLTITYRNTSNTGSHQHLLNRWMHGFIKRLSYVAFPIYLSRKREISQEMPETLSNLLQIRELVSERTGIHTQVFSVATPRGNQAGSSVIFLNLCPETWPWSPNANVRKLHLLFSVSGNKCNVLPNENVLLYSLRYMYSFFLHEWTLWENNPTSHCLRWRPLYHSLV